MAQALAPALVGPRPAQNRTPPIEVLVRAPVARLQRLGRQFGGLVDHMARVVEVPVAVEQPPLASIRL